MLDVSHYRSLPKLVLANGMVLPNQQHSLDTLAAMPPRYIVCQQRDGHDINCPTRSKK